MSRLHQAVVMSIVMAMSLDTDKHPQHSDEELADMDRRIKERREREKKDHAQALNEEQAIVEKYRAERLAKKQAYLAKQKPKVS